MTDLTTIKLSRETRDRLKARAGAEALSLGDYLELLATRAEREARWAALRQAVRATPLELMESYRAETAQWEQTEQADGDRGW
ncbi:MAG: hypothetical protein ACR2FV_03335 [Ornithinimicrobium sp.]|uniref:hypothetical protein n=1 Tax=Ornithinimicrobium sp. TaxID=1977084 RepID=UPI003D9B662F